jgi:hypothetical protein
MSEVPSDPPGPDNTTKQFGDACEMLVAGHLTLAGIPTTKMPDSWPVYDLVAQRPDGTPPQRISVKGRRQSDSRPGHRPTYRFDMGGWDWLALVWVPERGGPPQFWIIPADVLDSQRAQQGLPHAHLIERFGQWRDNFSLRRNQEGMA